MLAVRGVRNRGVVLDAISVGSVVDSVRLMRWPPVRPVVERRAVFRSTTREADEVSGSNLTLLIPVERSLVAIRRVPFLPVFSPTSMIFARGVRASAPVVFGCVVLAVFRFDARPRTSNVVSDVLTGEERRGVFVFCRVVDSGVILRATFDEVTLAVWCFQAGVDCFTEVFVLLRTVLLPGTIVRDARLEVLFATVDLDLVWTEEVRGLEVRVATSTVRCTGRERVVMLRFDRPEVAGFAGVGAVGLLEWEPEDRDDVLGDAAAGGAACLF